MPEPSWDTPWHPGASRRRLGSVSGASRGVPGAPRERPGGHQGHPGAPKSAPGSVQERAEATKIDAKSRPGAKKSRFGRATWLQRSVEANFRRFLSVFGFFAKSANPPKYCACQQKQRFGPSRCESSRSRDVTSKSDENRPENRPEIVEHGVSGPLGRPPGSTFVTLSESVERLGATRGDSSDSASDSERPSRSKWVGRGRSGRPGRAGYPEA